jgi:hypothetical protein
MTEILKESRFVKSSKVHTRSFIRKVEKKKVSILFFCDKCHKNLLLESKKQVRLHLDHCKGI